MSRFNKRIQRQKALAKRDRNRVFSENSGPILFCFFALLFAILFNFAKFKGVI